MTQPDRVLRRLAELPIERPSRALSERICAAGTSRLVPARVHPLWIVGVAASIVVYLGWAVVFTGG